MRTARSPGSSGVSILTRPEGRVQLPALTRAAGASGLVSILTRPEGRVQLRPVSQCGRGLAVSILTRPEGRVQQPSMYAAWAWSWFQSSPVPKDGCNRIPALPRCTARRKFQSSPVPKDGCNVKHGAAVSKVQKVSILTRPEGRVQRQRAVDACRVGPSFNPHPSRRTGATCKLCSSPLMTVLVSILTRPEGRVQLQKRWADGLLIGVSILTRPEGRVQRSMTLALRSARSLFQSSPVPKVGCNAGAAAQDEEEGSFNPHPSRRTGATDGKIVGVRGFVRVSILTRPEGRVQQAVRRSCQTSCFCFNPHPSRRTGATPGSSTGW